MVLEILSNIDPNLIIYGLVFVIFFESMDLVRQDLISADFLTI